VPGANDSGPFSLRQSSASQQTVNPESYLSNRQPMLACRLCAVRPLCRVWRARCIDDWAITLAVADAEKTLAPVLDLVSHHRSISLRRYVINLPQTLKVLHLDFCFFFLHTPYPATPIPPLKGGIWGVAQVYRCRVVTPCDTTATPKV
jgi:hypothetical protein